MSEYDRSIMRLPRWLARFWATLWGYFWQECPICREPFAGFEWRAGDSIPIRGEPGTFLGICPDCGWKGYSQEYEVRRDAFGFRNAVRRGSA